MKQENSVAKLGISVVYGGEDVNQHGIPKLRHLPAWSAMMQKPQWLCAVSAGSMLVGGLALIPGLLTVPAALGIAVSMVYAVLFLRGYGAARSSRRSCLCCRRAITSVPGAPANRPAGRRRRCMWPSAPC